MDKVVMFGGRDFSFCQNLLSIRAGAKEQWKYIEGRIPALARGVLTRKRLKQAHNNATKIQRAFRYHKDSAHFSKVKLAIPLLQKAVRGGLGRIYCQKRLDATNTISRAYSRYCEKKDQHKAVTDIARVYRGRLSRVSSTARQTALNEKLHLLSTTLAGSFRKQVYREALADKSLTPAQQKLILALHHSGVPFLPNFILVLTNSKMALIQMAEKNKLNEVELHKFITNKTQFTPEDFTKVSIFISRRLSSTTYTPNEADVALARGFGKRYLQLEALIQRNIPLINTFVTPPPPIETLYRSIGREKTKPLYPQLYAWVARVNKVIELYKKRIHRLAEINIYKDGELPDFHFVDLDRYLLLHQFFQPETQASVVLEAREAIFERDIQPDGKLIKVAGLLSSELIKAGNILKLGRKWGDAFGLSVGTDSLSKRVLAISSQGVPYFTLLFNTALRSLKGTATGNAEYADEFIQKTVDEAVRAKYLSPWERYDCISYALASFTPTEKEQIESEIAEKNVERIQAILVQKIKQNPPRAILSLYQYRRRTIDSAKTFNIAVGSVSSRIFHQRTSVMEVAKATTVFTSACEFLHNTGRTFEEAGRLGKVTTREATEKKT